MPTADQARRVSHCPAAEPLCDINIFALDKKFEGRHKRHDMNDLSKFARDMACPASQAMLKVIGPSGHILPLMVIRELIVANAFVVCGASPTKTAESLKIGRSTLYRMMKGFEAGQSGATQ